LEEDQKREEARLRSLTDRTRSIKERALDSFGTDPDQRSAGDEAAASSQQSNSEREGWRNMNERECEI